VPDPTPMIVAGVAIAAVGALAVGMMVRRADR
jgi:hypothetical protein